MPENGFGLGLLPPVIRLGITIGAIVYVQYEFNFRVVLGMLIFAIVLIALNLRLRFKYLFFSATIITFAFIFFGNLWFPPNQCTGANDIFGGLSSKCAVDFGLLFAVRRVAMLLFGFGWLNATNAVEMAEMTRRALLPFSRRYPYDRIGIFLFAIFDRLVFEYEVVNHSILVRAQLSVSSKLGRIRRNIFITYLKLSAVILRVFTNTPKIAFAIGMHGVTGKEISQLKIVNLFAGYEDGVDVLSDISLDANPGDVVLLSGPSGAGKSTLLRTIARYIPRVKGHARGTLVLGGEIWLPSNKELTETLPSLRMVTQDTYEFFLGLTVRQELSLHSNGLLTIEDAVALMGIGDLLDRNISSLSGGQRVRVILACVLASKVKLLLLDNPLSQLDENARQNFLMALSVYIREVQPIIFLCDRSEHLFVQVATRQIVMDHGRISKCYEGLTKLSLPSSAPVAVNYSDVSSSATHRIDGAMALAPLAGLEDVTVERNGRPVLERFSLSVFPGETIALVGPNGAGKTTAALALAGVLPLRAGIRFGAEGVGISFQTPELQFVELEVGDELAVKGKLCAVRPELTRRFCQEELVWMGLKPETEVLDLRPYQARLLSISSMLQATTVLVLDEPTIELPFEQIPMLNNRIEQLKSRGISVIIITHVLEVMAICNRVVEIKDVKQRAI